MSRKLTFWFTSMFREPYSALFKNHSLSTFWIMFLFNIPKKWTDKTWYYSHFTLTCFVITIPSSRFTYMYSELHYTYEFHILQHILLLISVIMWLKYLHFRMYCKHYMCYIITHLNIKYLKYVKCNYKQDCDLWQYIFKHLL